VTRDQLIERVATATTAARWELKVDKDDSLEIYGPDGRLLSARERNGWVTTYSYNSAGQLATVRNHFGRQIGFSYDAAGRVSTMVAPGGEITRYGYDPVGNLVSVGWPDGTTRRYQYEDSRHIHAMTGVIDEQAVRIGTYSYDDQGRVIETSRAGGSDRVQFGYGANFQSTQVTEYSTGKASTRTYTFQNMGGVIRPTGVTAPCSLCGSTAQSTLYNPSGDKVREVGHDGTVTFFAYDSRGRVTERATYPVGYASFTTRPALANASKVVTTRWHAAWNLPLQVAEPRQITSNIYDARGNLTSSTVAATSDTTGATQFAAAPTGATTATSSTYATNNLPTTIVQSVNGVETQRWTLTYNASGDATGITDVTGGGAAAMTSYDAHGRMLQGFTDTGVAVVATYTKRGQLTSLLRGGKSVSYTYDVRGLFTGATLPTGDRFEVIYDANGKPTDIRRNGTSLSPLQLAQATVATPPFGARAWAGWRKWGEQFFTALLPAAVAQVIVVDGQWWRPHPPVFDPRTDMLMSPMTPADEAVRSLAETFQRLCQCNPKDGYSKPTLTPGTYMHLWMGGHMAPMFSNQSYFTVPVNQVLVDRIIADPGTRKGVSGDRETYRATLSNVAGKIPWPKGSGVFAETRRVTLIVQRGACTGRSQVPNEIVTFYPGWSRADGP
jgi:YD repeat-containing protein